MSPSAISILKALEKSGDLSLEEITALIPKKYGDHRDFYVFASLATQGFVDDGMQPDLRDSDSPKPEPKEQLLSWKYFAMSSAEKTATYRGRSWSIHGGNETLKGQRFSLSGKGNLYLSEAKTKRFDRAFAIGSGILIGIIVALAAVLIERYVKGV
ncbi:hypothetical protein RCH06_000230 [Polaromonas sp. CG_9.5]|uniref:hypothetical protein n=1 Tax=Polaromonas sp. CG_9.5 TaxID=3071705 RepID=UPI002E01AEE7|nr:hypothetical protein [Polaromonas sp. CG_9.5]